METCGLKGDETSLPSSYPEFSDVHSFIQRFSAQLALPEVTLAALEGYFILGETLQARNAE